MPKVIYSADVGIYQEPGEGVQLNTLPVTTVQAKSAAATITGPGAYTMSSSAAAISMVMPLASAVPAGLFVFRNTSAHAHELTGSAETAGTRVFKAPLTGSGTQTVGSKIALPAVVGASVALISDGVNFCVLANTGSLVFSN